MEFTKPEKGGLGFALVGGFNGSTLRVKDICCGGVAEQDGRLRVGDILLEVCANHSLSDFSVINHIEVYQICVCCAGEWHHCIRTEPQ